MAYKIDQSHCVYCQLRDIISAFISRSVFVSNASAGGLKFIVAIMSFQWWMCFVKRKFMDKSLSGPGQ